MEKERKTNDESKEEVREKRKKRKLKKRGNARQEGIKRKNKNE